MKTLNLITLSCAVVALLAAGGVLASEDLAKKNGCAACHAVDKKIVGPSWKDVAAKYKGDAKAPEALAAKVKAGGKGAWGTVPMPPQTKVADADLKTLVAWVLTH
jgi:cytochrome c